MELYNDKYNRAAYNHMKKIYANNFALGVRILNDQNAHEIIHDNKHPYHQDPHTIIMNFFNILTPNHPILKYWMEDLNKIILSSINNFYQYFLTAFEHERSETPKLTKIDKNILWLFILNICHKSALKRYEIDWKLYRSKKEPQLGDRIRHLTVEIVYSMNNLITLLKVTLQAIVSYRDDLIRLSKERNDESIRSHKEQNRFEVTQKGFAEIQVWFDELVSIIDDTRQLMMIMCGNDKTCCDAEMKKEIDDIFKLLIESILVVDVQPPDIVKTDTNSISTVRMLLTLSKLRNITKNQLKIIIKELSIWSWEFVKESKTKSTDNKIMQPPKIQIEENEHDIQFPFKKFKVKKVNRSKPSDDKNSVIENKYVLKYSIVFHINNEVFTASTESWPVLVIVHQNQEAIAKAAVMWDIHFPHIVRSKNASVPWDQMRVLLVSFFKTETECELNEKQLDALYEKASREDIINGNQFYWTASCNSCHELKFSFWNWFHGTMKFTRDHISKLWKNGLIDGFVSQKYLEESSVGTFALRFSESVIGGLIIMYVEYNSETGENEVTQLEPILIEGSQIKNHPSKEPANVVIVDIIRDLKECKHLCDGRQKDEAFQTFYKQSSNNKNPKYKSINTRYGVNSNNPTNGLENTAQVFHGGIENTYNRNSTVFNGSVPNYNAVSNSLNSGKQISAQEINPQIINTINYLDNTNTICGTTTLNDPIKYNMATEVFDNASASMPNFNVLYSSLIQNSPALSNDQDSLFGDDTLSPSMASANDEDYTMGDSSILNTPLSVNRIRDSREVLTSSTSSNTSAHSINTALPEFRTINSSYQNLKYYSSDSNINQNNSVELHACLYNLNLGVENSMQMHSAQSPREKELLKEFYEL